MKRSLLLATMILSALAYELRAGATCRWAFSRPPVLRLAGAARRRRVRPVTGANLKVRHDSA